MNSSKTSAKQNQIDPLFTIFEQHLYNFQDSDTDRKTFITKVVDEYLTYLRKLSIVIPKSLEAPIVEELATQVNTMLVKKMYGCLTIQDYQKKIPTQARKRAKNQYTKLARAAKTQKAAAKKVA